jgi:hypothetical protein
MLRCKFVSRQEMKLTVVVNKEKITLMVNKEIEFFSMANKEPQLF